MPTQPLSEWHSKSGVIHLGSLQPKKVNSANSSEALPEVWLIPLIFRLYLIIPNAAIRTLGSCSSLWHICYILFCWNYLAFVSLAVSVLCIRATVGPACASCSLGFQGREWSYRDEDPAFDSLNMNNSQVTVLFLAVWLICTQLIKNHSL